MSSRTLLHQIFDIQELPYLMTNIRIFIFNTNRGLIYRTHIKNINIDPGTADFCLYTSYKVVFVNIEIQTISFLYSRMYKAQLFIYLYIYYSGINDFFYTI